MNASVTVRDRSAEQSSANFRSWGVLVILLTLFAFGWRWYYDASARVPEPTRGDAAQYYNYAYNLRYEHVFSKSGDASVAPVPDSFRDPGYPFFLAAWMAVFDDQQAWYASVIMSQAALGALSVLFLVLLVRRWLSAPVALGTGLLASIWPHTVAIGSLLLTETLFSFLLLLATYLLAIALERMHVQRFFWAGVTFGCASVVNSILLPLAPLLAIFLRFRRVEWRFAAPLLAGALLLPAAWMLRNVSIPAGSESARDRAMINFVEGSWPEYHSAYRGTRVTRTSSGPETLARITEEQNAMIKSPAAGFSALAARIASDPMKYAAWYLARKPALFWAWAIEVGQGDIYVFPTIDSPYEKNPFWRALRSLCRALNPFILGAALAGAVLIMLRRFGPAHDSGRPAAQMVVLSMIYATVIYDVFQAEPRYSIPFRPLEFAVAATAVSFLMRWLRDRRRTSSQPGAPERVALPKGTE